MVSCCLMGWPAKYILISLKSLLFEKRMDLVWSPLKWADSLLSMKHWYSDKKSLFKTSSVFQRPHVGRKVYHLHTNRSQLLNDWQKSFTYNRKKSCPKIKPCGTPCVIGTVSEKTSKQTKNFLFQREDSNHLKATFISQKKGQYFSTYS